MQMITERLSKWDVIGRLSALSKSKWSFNYVGDMLNLYKVMNTVELTDEQANSYYRMYLNGEVGKYAGTRR